MKWLPIAVLLAGLACIFGALVLAALPEIRALVPVPNQSAGDIHLLPLIVFGIIFITGGVAYSKKQGGQGQSSDKDAES